MPWIFFPMAVKQFILDFGFSKASFFIYMYDKEMPHLECSFWYTDMVYAKKRFH